MPNTTNFNWTTPADTDLVKNGALAIRTLANGIDTSLVDLKGGTTGQVLSKATNTDLDFTWVTQDDSNAIQNAIIDAKGDLIVGTAADTPARLAVGGTNGHVLTVDSTEASGMKWAAAAGNGMTLLATLTLTGSSVTSSTFSSAYKQLFVYYKGVYFNTGQDLNMRLNADTGSNYYYRNIAASDGGVNSYEGQAQTSWRLGGGDTSSTSYNTANGFVTIMNPSDTDWVFGVNSHYRNGSSGTDTQNWNNTLVYDSSAAITSVTMLTGATFSGGTAYVYGVN